MRTKSAALMLAAALTACTRMPVADEPNVTFSIQPYESKSSPSPLYEVRAGFVRSVYPSAWEAKPLSSTVIPQEGFVASPRPDKFERAAGFVQGIEAFWIDVGKLSIPSDYYYLAARSQGIAALRENKACRQAEQEVFVDHPPDFTGRHFSPSDYVASASGTCRVYGRATRWVYVVAAPGFGPVREIGIPNSGLYVVLAVVSGPHSDRLLHEMIEGSRFGDSTVTQIMQAAGQAI